MNKQQHNIDELFREALNGHRNAPPPAAWTDIERRLGEERRRRSPYFFLRWPWMLGLMLAIGTGGWLAAQQSADSSSVGAEATTTLQHAGHSNHRAPKQDGQRSSTASSENYNESAAQRISAVVPYNTNPVVLPTMTAIEAVTAAEQAAGSSLYDAVGFPAGITAPAVLPVLFSTTRLHPNPGAAPLPITIFPLTAADMPSAAMAIGELNHSDGEHFQDLKPADPLRFTLGADLGFEMATRGAASGRYTAGLSLSWEFTPGFSVGVMPTYRFGEVARRQLTGETSTVTNSDCGTFTTTIYDTMNGVVTNYLHTTETYDSIVTSATTSGGGRYWEVSVPLLFSFQSKKGWSAGVGPTVNFGGDISGGSGGEAQTFHIANHDSEIIVKSFMQPALYSGNTVTNNVEVPHPQPGVGADPKSLRLGYMLNVGYRWRQLMLNASLSQQLSGYSALERSFRGVFSSPYLRLTLGYRLPMNIRRPSFR